MATAQGATSEEVFRSTLAYFITKYPSHDCAVYLPQLVLDEIISPHESALVNAAETPVDRGSRLFCQFLPIKSWAKISKAFDILRLNFEKEVTFLDGQQNRLESPRIEKMEETLAQAKSAFYQRLETQVKKIVNQGGLHSKRLEDLMEQLEDLKKGQQQTVETVEKVLSNISAIVHESTNGQQHPETSSVTDDSSNIPSATAKNDEQGISYVPTAATKTVIENTLWRFVAYQKELRNINDEWKAVEISIGIIERWNPDQTFTDSLRGFPVRHRNSPRTGVDGYHHPRNVLLKFCEVYHADPPLYQREEYLEKIGIMKCDIILIVSDDSVSPEFSWAAKILKEKGKNFYYICLIDHRDKALKRRADPHDPYDPLATAKIKSDLVGLHNDVDIFLIAKNRRDLFDFDLLSRRLISDLPRRTSKQRSLILTLDNISEEIIKLKAICFREMLAVFARSTELGDALPPPIIKITPPKRNFEIDGALILCVTEFFFEAFGLDYHSLKRMSILWKCDFDVLTEVLRQPRNDYLSLEGIDAFVQSLSDHQLERAPDRFLFAHAKSSTVAIWNVLEYCIDNLEELALQVFKTAQLLKMDSD